VLGLVTIVLGRDESLYMCDLTSSTKVLHHGIKNPPGDVCMSSKSACGLVGGGLILDTSAMARLDV
jgi:hypothetical protein